MSCTPSRSKNSSPVPVMPPSRAVFLHRPLSDYPKLEELSRSCSPLSTSDDLLPIEEMLSRRPTSTDNSFTAPVATRPRSRFYLKRRRSSE